MARKGEGAERTHPQEVCLDENQGQRVDKGLAGHGTRSGRVEYPLEILRGDCQKRISSILLPTERSVAPKIYSKMMLCTSWRLLAQEKNERKIT